MPEPKSQDRESLFSARAETVRKALRLMIDQPRFDCGAECCRWSADGDAEEALTALDGLVAELERWRLVACNVKDETARTARLASGLKAAVDYIEQYKDLPQGRLLLPALRADLDAEEITADELTSTERAIAEMKGEL